VLRPEAQQSRVARFFGPIIPNWEKYTKWPQTIPNGHKLYQTAVSIPNGHKIYQHFPFEGHPKFNLIAIFGLEINHLATLLSTLAWIQTDDVLFWITTCYITSSINDLLCCITTYIVCVHVFFILYITLDLQMYVRGSMFQLYLSLGMNDWNMWV
jgi:hypothetical protein